MMRMGRVLQMAAIVSLSCACSNGPALIAREQVPLTGGVVASAFRSERKDTILIHVANCTSEPHTLVLPVEAGSVSISYRPYAPEAPSFGFVCPGAVGRLSERVMVLHPNDHWLSECTVHDMSLDLIRSRGHPDTA